MPGAEHAPGTATESASETHDVAQQPEQPDDEEQPPHQIHIQQHLKLHFHNKGKFLFGELRPSKVTRTLSRVVYTANIMLVEKN